MLHRECHGRRREHSATDRRSSLLSVANKLHQSRRNRRTEGFGEELPTDRGTE